MSLGAFVSANATNCRGGLLSTVLSSADGGRSDWFVGGIAEVEQAILQKELLGLDSLDNTLDLWTSSQADEPDDAAIWFGVTNVWTYSYATYSEAYVIAMRAF
jgi:hypothetical protein